MKIHLEHLPADAVGLADLARTALAQGPDFAPFPVPRRASDVPRPEDRHAARDRELLALGLRAGLTPLEPPDRVLTSLNVLANEDVFCIVAGQQPGFLCSPLYSLYKAMQACRLANELAGAWGRPVVPVFWNHADDHDVAEVHHAWQLNRNLDLQKVGLAGLSSGRLPIGRLPLDEERQRLGALRALLAQMFEEHPHTEAALDLFFPRAGETLARALTRAFTALLGEHGLVVLEPDWVREPLSRALAQVVTRVSAEALARGARQVADLGFEPGIDPERAALVYHVGAEGRRALRAGGDGYRYDDEPGSRTAEELAAEVLQSPEEWSAGALLRPLVQDSALPVAATVGGFGELAYHAELGPARDAAGLPRSPFVPRLSCTLVDSDTRHSCSKLGVDARTALADRGQVGADSEDESAAPAVVEALRKSARRAARELLEHRDELAELDPALGANLARTADQVRGVVGKLIQKAERVHANRAGKGGRQRRRIANMLYPRSLAQERVLGPFQFTARFGRAWIEALYEELPAVCAEHVAVHLLPDEELESETDQENART